MSCGCEHEHGDEREHDGGLSGVANPAVIDMFGFDQKRNEVLLVMTEERPWDGGDEQLHEVQEKFNAYASFLLDGEMIAAHPELEGKPARIELRCAFLPDDRAVALLAEIHDQLELQEIEMEVVVAESGGGCGAGCACHGE
ncbi:MAG: hypothetical protein M3032_07725 [Verrucomicrobiota bacterium]|nr:hypothetical protein [Verrucomicrobiota bacterium]